MKKILNILKRIIVSAFVLYGYNLIAVPLDILIPINIFTVLYIALFGVPAMFSLITIFVLVF